MTDWISKEINYRGYYKKNMYKKLIYKVALANFYLNLDLKIYFHHKHLSLDKKSAISFYRNKCLMHDWSRSVFRKFKMSRHQSKFYASAGLICGLRKSSF